MSAIIDPAALVFIRVWCRPILSEENQVTGIRIVPDSDPDKTDATLVVAQASGRDFETMSQILEQATVINQVTGRPMLRTKVLCHLIVSSFFRRWNLADAAKRVLPIEYNVVGGLHHRLVRALAYRWLEQT